MDRHRTGSENHGTSAMRNKLWVLVFVLAAFAQAHADAAFLLEEPFGRFGSFNPTGHAAVYLTRVCAASPTRLRRCEPGQAGVIISRYYKVAGYDWLVIPLLPYVYAVDSPQDIPRFADAQSVAALRDAYRRDHLLAIAPSNAEGRAPEGEWVQLIGSAYDRKLYGFRIETSPGQDDAFIKQFNNQKNTSHFNLLFHNCADFARTVLNSYYPHAVHRNLFGYAGITTPKQVAKSLVSYCRHHPDVMCSSFAIPQVSGSIHRSGPADDLFEALLNTNKYVLPRAILHPVVTDSLAVARLIEGRFNPRRNAAVFDVDSAVQPQWAETAIPMVPNFTFESRISSAISPKGAESEWTTRAGGK
jgi:hypothetical protein